jgi:insulysin
MSETKVFSRKLIFSVIALVLVVASAGVGFWLTQNASDLPQHDDRIVRAKTDTRAYQYVELDNGLRALAISDANADQATVAINVETGSNDDPVDRPGLAHFLEHMLFLGTEKYPQPDEYQTFISQHGGQHNAFTAGGQTVYYFNIDQDQLEPALDRFAQFFIAPLFDEDLVERERHAVESEYRAGLQDDSRRFQDVWRESLNPNHPSSKFAAGNLETLQVDGLREALVQFYQQQYSSERMTLVVYGQQDTDTLSQWIRDLFDQVPNRRLPEVQPLPAQYQSSQLPSLINVEPRKDIRQLTLSFPIPGPLTNLDVRPHTYVGWLLNRESAGSLYAVLRDRGLVESLDAGVRHSTNDPTTFDIGFSLTENGLQQINDVIELTFDAIQLIQQRGVQQWIFDELAQLQQLRFDYQEAYRPISYAIQLSQNLRHYPEQDLLAGWYRHTEYDPQAIKQWLDNLTPDNMMVWLQAKGLKTNRQSQWYNTPYKRSSISTAALRSWRNQRIDSALTVPEPNPFIPTDLTLLPPSRQASTLYEYLPDVYLNTPAITLWHHQDMTFNTPKMEVRLRIENDWFRANAQNTAATLLYIKLVEDSLTDISFDAVLAGLGHDLWTEAKGIGLQVYGYNQTLPLYLDAVINELVTLTPRLDRFNSLKAEMIRKYRNQTQDRLTSQIYREFHDMIVPGFMTGEELIPVLEQLQPSDLVPVQAQLTGNVHLTALVHGNVQQKTSIELGQRLTNNFNALGADISDVEVVRLNKQTSRYRHEQDHDDSALMIYYQGDTNDYRERALYELLNQMMESPFFARLRTDKQLGYVVYTAPVTIYNVPGMALIVQSPNVDPALLQQHVEKFLEDEFHQLLTNLSDDELESYKQGLITQFSQTEQSLLEAGERFWKNIKQENVHFNYDKRIALEIEKITQTGLLKFYENQWLNADARRLIISKIGEGQEDNYQKHRVNKPGTRIIENAAQLQEQSERFYD